MANQKIIEQKEKEVKEKEKISQIEKETQNKLLKQFGE